MSAEYCTYFDGNYAGRATALFASMQEHVPGAHLWALCLDEAARRKVESLASASITAISLTELELAKPELLEVKPTRSTIEYYFTLTPLLLQHVRSLCPGTRLNYVDADLYFFAPPAPLEEEVGDASIAIIEHGFAPALRHHEKSGRFNVGWLSFADDDVAQACIDWWGERTLEWCYDRLEGDRYADQKYLDQWPARYGAAVHVVRHAGANVAPWNVGARHIQWDGKRVTVNGEPLLFFHFHGLKQVNRALYDAHLRTYRATMTTDLRRHVYRPYLGALQRARGMVGDPALPDGIRLARRGAARRTIGTLRAAARSDLLSVLPQR